MRTRRLLAVLIAVLALAGGHATSAPAMWAVKSRHATVYLFGSMHILEAGIDWRTPAFDAAYARSSVVWFEADAASLADPAKMDALVTRYGLDPDHPLSSKITPEDLAALKARLDAAGLPEERFERFKPWMAALIVTGLPFHRQGFESNVGADAAVNRSAAADRKAVRGFETAETTARGLSELPDAVQVQLLEDSLHEDSRPMSQIKNIEAAWLAGDLARLGPMLTQEMSTERPALYDLLIRRRNRAWAAVIAEQLHHPGVQMVSVGALHMVGRDGLTSLLRARGFKVVRVQ
ncbi:MAG: TraB/GumN family protein [Caulobacterales bacterium]